MNVYCIKSLRNLWSLENNKNTCKDGDSQHVCCDIAKPKTPLNFLRSCVPSDGPSQFPLGVNVPSCLLLPSRPCSDTQLLGFLSDQTLCPRSNSEGRQLTTLCSTGIKRPGPGRFICGTSNRVKVTLLVPE